MDSCTGLRSWSRRLPTCPEWNGGRPKPTSGSEGEHFRQKVLFKAGLHWEGVWNGRRPSENTGTGWGTGWNSQHILVDCHGAQLFSVRTYWDDQHRVHTMTHLFDLITKNFHFSDLIGFVTVRFSQKSTRQWQKPVKVFFNDWQNMWSIGDVQAWCTYGQSGIPETWPNEAVLV